MVVPPTAPTRNDLRRVMREIRARFVAGLGAGEHATLNTALVARLEPLVAGYARVAGYAAMPDEIDPAGLGYTIWPRVCAAGEPLSFHDMPAGELLASPGWGIREPAANAPIAHPDLILVPLVAADPQGNRLGHGKGYYDRTLPRHEALRVGVAFDCQVIDHAPAEAWDAPLDWLVTPTRTIRCGVT